MSCHVKVRPKYISASVWNELTSNYGGGGVGVMVSSNMPELLKFVPGLCNSSPPTQKD